MTLPLIEQLHLADRDRTLVPVEIGVAVLGNAVRLAPTHRVGHFAHDARGVLRVFEADDELIRVGRAARTLTTSRNVFSGSGDSHAPPAPLAATRR